MAKFRTFVAPSKHYRSKYICKREYLKFIHFLGIHRMKFVRQTFDCTFHKLPTISIRNCIFQVAKRTVFKVHAHLFYRKMQFGHKEDKWLLVLLSFTSPVRGILVIMGRFLVNWQCRRFVVTIRRRGDVKTWVVYEWPVRVGDGRLVVIPPSS